MTLTAALVAGKLGLPRCGGLRSAQRGGAKARFLRCDRCEPLRSIALTNVLGTHGFQELIACLAQPFQRILQVGRGICQWRLSGWVSIF